MGVRQAADVLCESGLRAPSAAAGKGQINPTTCRAPSAGMGFSESPRFALGISQQKEIMWLFPSRRK